MTNLRWKKDPYLLLHAELLSMRNMLVGPDLNDVQQALFYMKRYRDLELDSDRKRFDFEEKLFLSSPERYNAYLESKKQADDDLDGMDIDEVEWKVPTDSMEYEKLEKEFQSLFAQHQEDLEKQAGLYDEDWDDWGDD
jgi:hypothetical protein